MTDPHRRDYAFLARDAKARTHDEQMFSGALSFCRRRYAATLEGVDVAVVGAPYDVSVSNRPGCRFGPRAIRAASAQLSWSHSWPHDFDPFERISVVDWGDIHLDLGDPAGLPRQMEAALAHIIAAGATPLVLGGDHFCTYPALRARHAALGRPMALVQFDAHRDTGEAPPDWIDHGTMFARAVNEGIVDPDRSIQVGIRTTYDNTSGIEAIDGVAVQEMGTHRVAESIRAKVGDAPVYLTFDIDCLDPAYAPGTGTPVCGGLTSGQALAILRGLSGIGLVGMDVVEVAPAYDVSEITALAGATIALHLLCLYAERA